MVREWAGGDEYVNERLINNKLIIMMISGKWWW